MTLLLVACRRCGSEVPSTAGDASGLCALCVVSDAVATDKAEYGRIWARYVRYRANPKVRSLASLEEQLSRIARRLGDKVHARIPQPEHAIAIGNAHLAEARERVERGAGRIVLPRAGDLSQGLVSA